MKARLPILIVAVTLSACIGAPEHLLEESQPLFDQTEASLEREGGLKRTFLVLCATHDVRTFLVTGVVNEHGRTASVHTSLSMNLRPDTMLRSQMNRYQWPVRRRDDSPVGWRFEQEVVCPAPASNGD